MTESSRTAPLSAFVAGRVGLVVRLTSHEGGRLAVLDALNRYADRLHEEPGTDLFVLSIDPDDDTVVWLYEWFRDDDAQLAHQRSAGFRGFLDEMTSLLAQPPGVLRIDPLRMHMQPAVLEQLSAEVPDSL